MIYNPDGVFGRHRLPVLSEEITSLSDRIEIPVVYSQSEDRL
jgi:hypothetical protein